MLRRGAALLVFLAFAASVRPQGLNVPPGVTKDDWEEINFEFNSSVLVDGFPSLLRLAELLQANQGYKVMVEGHTDLIGSNQYNDRLGLARANAVRDFLIKYGAQPGQIMTSSQGENNPRYPGQKNTYTRTDEARWMNRRVSLTVLNAEGQPVSAAGGAAEAIKALQPQAPAAANTDCCNEVLKRLDKLDDIAKMLKDLGDENADLKKQLSDLKAAQQVLESKVNQPPPTPPAPPTAAEVGNAVAQTLEAKKEPKFTLLGINAGVDNTGNTTFSGKGRFFAPFGGHFGFQAEAEYLYFKTDREGQGDIGLVDRIGHFQAGLFASLKYADLTQYQNGGTLGQASVTLDYIFKRGMIGAYGTKGFKTSSLVNSVNATDPFTGATLNHILLNSYLSIVDQAGVNATVGLWGNNYLEGNAGYLHGLLVGNRFGGTLRLIFPINDRIAFTAEGDMNPTLIGPGNDGRAVFGMEFGNMLRPKELFAADHAVPAQIPRVRFEVITKRVRNGNDAPVADAGPNQINVPAGVITLDGSRSYDPDGDALTYLWEQVVGPTAPPTSTNTAVTTFKAVPGQYYTYRLTVTDSFGARSSAYVSVSTKDTPSPTVAFFTATPASITAGQSSTLSWSVTNATSVTISGVNGNLGATGSVPVTPTATTTYTLTATNGNGTTTAMVTVVVNAAQLSFQYCYAAPANIMAAESSTLNWSAPGATSVTISGASGSFSATGTFAVTPTQTTNYTVMATGTGGVTTTCNIGVAVTPGQVPRILEFAAIPMTINSGEKAILNWVVDNATSVSIDNGVGSNLALSGQIQVSPATSTTYTLTATNKNGSVTATTMITVKVIPLPVITSFTADQPTSASAGGKVTLTCNTQNATTVTIAQSIFYSANAVLAVYPTVTTTYTCVATNQIGQHTQASTTVVVPPTTAPGGPAPVVTFAGGDTMTTINRTVTLDASASYSPAGNNPLTYRWSVVSGNAADVEIVNPLSATPTVTLNIPGKEYDFQVQVTDSKGNTAVGVIRVTLVPNVTTN